MSVPVLGPISTLLIVQYQAHIFFPRCNDGNAAAVRRIAARNNHLEL
jgi:hypothetical protein